MEADQEPIIAEVPMAADSSGTVENSSEITTLLSAEEEQFLNEENDLIKQLEDLRARYLRAEVGLENVDEEENNKRREAYSQKLHELIVHKCRYAIRVGDFGGGTRSLAEHLLETVCATILHDRDRRDMVCSEFSADRFSNKIRSFIETRPWFRFSVTVALGGAAIASSHLGHLPEYVSTDIEDTGIGLTGLAAGLGTYVSLDRLKRNKFAKHYQKQLHQKQAEMLADATATEHYTELLGDYVSPAHHDYFVDRVHHAKDLQELEQIILELEKTIDQDSPHRDVRDLAEFVKFHHRETLSKKGLLEMLEAEPDSPETHKALIIELLKQELADEEKERDELSKKLAIVIAALIGGLASTVGGSFFGYRPLDSPLDELPEDDNHRDHR